MSRLSRLFSRRKFAPNREAELQSGRGENRYIGYHNYI